MTKNILGVYFGYDSVCMSIYKDNEPTIIPNQEGSLTTPTVISFAKDRRIIVGEEAKKQQFINVARVVSHLRDLKTGFEKEVDGITYTAERLWTIFFKKLKDDAEAYLHEVVSTILVVLPSNFNYREKFANSISLAGFKEVFFDDEEKALLAHYHYVQKKSEHDKLVHYHDNIICIPDEERLMFVVSEGLQIRVMNVQVVSTRAKILNRTEYIWYQDPEMYDMILKFVQTLDGADSMKQQDINQLCHAFASVSGLYTIKLSKQFNVRELLTIQRIYNELEVMQQRLKGQYLRSLRLYIPYVAANEHGPVHIDIEVNFMHYNAAVTPFVEKIKRTIREWTEKKSTNDTPFFLVSNTGIQNYMAHEIVYLATCVATRDIVPYNPHEEVSFKSIAIGVAYVTGKYEYQKITKLPLEIAIGVKCDPKNPNLISLSKSIIQNGESLPIKNKQVRIAVPNTADELEIVSILSKGFQTLGTLKLHKMKLSSDSNPQQDKYDRRVQNLYVTFNIDELGKMTTTAISSSGTRSEFKYKFQAKDWDDES